MERRWEKRPPPLPPPRLEREHPSFSAALLDAIYRSIDTSPDHQQQPKSINAPPADFWRDPRATVTDHRIPTTPKRYPTTPRYRTASISSTPRHRSNRPNRVRPDPFVLDSPPNEETNDLVAKNDKKKAKKKKKKSIKSLLKSFFFFKRDKRVITGPEELRESMVEAVSFSSRSCMSIRRKSEGQKRSVRFARTVTVIMDEESQQCGDKCIYNNVVVERRVEELIKSLKGEEKKEKRIDSDSSTSELFEVEAVEHLLSVYN